jgi:tRNA dimethylallyltransferase
MSARPNVLCIVGPTACGKTALSVALAKKLGGEIVSAEAVAVYRGLDIGSAKPTEAEREGVPHHLIDCVDVTDDSFTVSSFRALAREAIDDILRRKKLPIVVGGSGLYVDAVFSDMRFSAPSDSAIRAAIEKEYDACPEAVFAALRSADPVTAQRLHPNDKKRVVRALEVFRVSGQPFSALNREFSSVQQGDDTYRSIRIGLNTDRQKLYARIDRRVDRMMADGLKEEAFSFFDRGLTPDNCRALQSIGYAQLFNVYTGSASLGAAVEQIKLDTRHFAKRQITWFKRDQSTVWYDPTEQTLEALSQRITEKFNGNQ